MKSTPTKSEKIAYIAGIVDGEGCIFIGRKRPSGKMKSLQYEAKISIVMTKLQAISVCQEIFGGTIRLKREKRNPKWSNTYVWCLYAKKASDALRRMLPFLTVKRQQALLLIKYQDAVTRCGGHGGPGAHTTKKELATREDFYLQMRELNKRGPK